MPGLWTKFIISTIFFSFIFILSIWKQKKKTHEGENKTVTSRMNWESEWCLMLWIVSSTKPNKRHTKTHHFATAISNIGCCCAPFIGTKIFYIVCMTIYLFTFCIFSDFDSAVFQNSPLFISIENYFIFFYSFLVANWFFISFYFAQSFLRYSLNRIISLASTTFMIFISAITFNRLPFALFLHHICAV